MGKTYVGEDVEVWVKRKVKTYELQNPWSRKSKFCHDEISTQYQGI